MFQQYPHRNGPPKGARQTYEHAISKQKHGEHMRADYGNFLGDFKRAQGNLRSDGRVENKRHMKRIQQQRDELVFEENIRAQSEKQDYLRLVREQDEMMAKALWEQQNERDSEARRAQRVCADSEELVHLRQQISAAQTQYKRQQQLHEQAMSESEHLKTQAALDQMMEEDRLARCQRQDQIVENRRFANYQSRYALQHQMNEKEILRQEQWAAQQKEKAAVDQVVADLRAEDEAKLAERIRQRNQFKKEMHEFIAQRETFIKQEALHVVAVLKDIEKHEKLQQQRAAEVKARRDADEQVRDAVLSKLSSEIIQQRKEAEEYRELLLELYDMEAERRAEAEIAARAQKKREQVYAFKRSSEEHRRHVEEERVKAEAALAAEQQEMMEKYMENARLEEMNERTRRQKMNEHRRAVLAMIAEKKAKYEEAAQTDMLDEEFKAKEEAYKAEIIKRERLRLLRENAEQLRRYVPKSLFKTQEEIEAVWGPGAFRDAPVAFSPYGASQSQSQSQSTFSYAAAQSRTPRTPGRTSPTQGRFGTPTSASAASPSRFSSSLRMAGSSALGARSPSGQGFGRPGF